MGREISSQEILCEDTFLDRLRSETSLVMQWFKENAYDPASPAFGGLELEAWLIDRDGFPSERNLEFLERLADPAMVPELAAFNFEFNSEPHLLSHRCFSDFEDELNTHWTQARATADQLGLRPMMIGIPPTLREAHLSLETITPSERYRLLNQRLFQLRGGKPLRFEIEGRDQLCLIQSHLMTEAACTSLQVHLMTSQANAARHYNAMQAPSAAIVAISANSPFLYGRRLWEETRIPAFESAVNLPGPRGLDGRHASRVTFGERYLKSSMMELFIENLHTYVPFLPMVSQSEREALVHLKLQNGTIWRWNRPIVHASSGKPPHLRIENRVMAAGPTVVDVVANTAFAIGLTLHLSGQDRLEERLPFELARRNFYASAKRGLGASIIWLDGEVHDIQELIRNELADAAEHALIDAGISALDASYYMGIIRARARNGQTGAAWQRAHANCNGNSHQKMVQDYLERQDEGQPVHRWKQ